MTGCSARYGSFSCTLDAPHRGLRHEVEFGAGSLTFGSESDWDPCDSTVRLSYDYEPIYCRMMGPHDVHEDGHGVKWT